MKAWSCGNFWLVAIAAFGLVASGCTEINDIVQNVSVEPVMTFTKEEKDKLSPDNQISVIDLDTYKFPEDKNNNTSTAMMKAATSKVARNRLQSALLARSDTKCSKFRKFIYAVHGTRKLAFRSLTLALSGAGAIFGGASQALSGASAGFQGFDEAFDAEVLQQQSITLILQTISSTRKGLKGEIDVKRGNGIEDYPAEEAIQDVVQYHRLCSFTEAIAQLGSAVGENQKNKEMVKELKDKVKKLEPSAPTAPAGGG